MTKYAGFVVLYYIFICFVSGDADKIRVDFLDVGQGDSSVVRVGGKSLFFDYGKDLSSLASLFRLNKLFLLLDFCGNVNLYLTHTHADHIGGLPRYLIFCKIRFQNKSTFNDISQPDLTSHQFADKFLEIINLNKKLFTYGTNKKLEVIPFAENIKTAESNSDNFIAAYLLTFSGISELTITGAVSRHLSYFRILILGDADIAFQRRVLAKLEQKGITKLNVVQIPHHGSKNNLYTALFERLSPEYCVISVGPNSYGHPTPEVLEFLKNKTDCKVLRTDLHGTISFSLQ